MSIERNLERIANALEALVQSRVPGYAVTIDEVEHVSPTLTRPPLAWFDAGNGCAVAVEDTPGDASPGGSIRRTGQTTWDWLGVLDGEAVKVGNPVDPGETPRQASRRMRRGRPLRCGRCRREGRSRMNHSDRCIECIDEDWWDE